MKFLAWDPLNESRETATVFDIDAGIEEDAALAWAEQDEQSGEPFNGWVDVLVCEPHDTGTPLTFRVHVDYSRDYTVCEQVKAGHVK